MVFWAAAAALGLALAALFARRGWPFELAAHWRPQIVAAGGGLGVVGIAAGEFTTALAALAAAGVAAAGMSLAAPLRLASPSGPAVARDACFTIVFCNVWGRAEAALATARLARAERADLVVLVETPEQTMDEAATVFAEYPARIDAGVTIAPGSKVAAFGRRAFDGLAQTHLRPVLRLSPRLRDGRSLRVIGLHAPAPLTPKGLAGRDAYLADALDALPEDGRWVAVGDFNLTPWAPAFEGLPGRRAGDPTRESTWLSGLPLLGLSIDHALIGPGLRLVSYRVGPFVGSDHRPLIVTVAAL